MGECNLRNYPGSKSKVRSQGNIPDTLKFDLEKTVKIFKKTHVLNSTYPMNLIRTYIISLGMNPTETNISKIFQLSPICFI